jgi:aminoglycoside phosphotransferase (APT) family kinase protein
VVDEVPARPGRDGKPAVAPARIATKRDLTADQIQEYVWHGLGPRAGLAGYHEITDGTFAAVYAVTLTDGRDLVLKVGPPAGTRLMRYEFDLTHTEIKFYRRAGAAGVPLPRLHAADPDLGYLLIGRLRGQPLLTAREAMTPEQLARVRCELGGVCARLRGVTDPLFGYPRRDGHTRSPSWRESFLTIVDDVLADAVEYRRELPAPAAAIRRLVDRRAGLLDEVATPALVHFDVWDGNVFVLPATDGDGYVVEGLIDGERAFYGDPIAELVSLALFDDPANQPGLLPGYLGRSLTDRERTRLRLYTVYIYLIILTEDATRGFDPAAHEPVRRATLAHLDAELAALGRP